MDSTARVFINYRRNDTGDVAGRLYDHLKQWLGDTQVFIDQRRIRPLANLRKAIDCELYESDVVIALIGKEWSELFEERSRSEDDFVLFELEVADRLGVPVAPVLVNNAAMPSAEKLPEKLRALILKTTAARLRTDDFENDVASLVNHLAHLQTESRMEASGELEELQALVPSMACTELNEQLCRLEAKGRWFKKIAPYASVLRSLRQGIGPLAGPDHVDRVALSGLTQLTVMKCGLIPRKPAVRQFDPEDFHGAVGRWRGLLAQALEHFGGRAMSKDVGDGTLVAFGFPSPDEHDANRAVRVALELVDRVETSVVDLEDQFAIRVGICTGDVVVDTSAQPYTQSDWTTGEVMFRASELQTLAGSGEVVISETTRRLIRIPMDSDEIWVDGRLAGHRVSRWVESPRFQISKTRKNVAQVGRGAQMDALREAWGRVLSKEGVTVLISGDAGIGKSRLIEEFLADIDVANRRLRFSCSPDHQNTTLYPIARLLELAIGVDEECEDTEKIERLGRFLDITGPDDEETLVLFSAFLSLKEQSQLKSGSENFRERLLLELERQLIARSKSRPMVVVFEDLQWADPTTLELLERVVGSVENYPVLLLVSTRTKFSPTFKDHPDVRTITLSRLSVSESSDLVAELTSDSTLTTDDCDAIVQRCDGVPLFLEEVASYVIEDAAGAGGLEAALSRVPRELLGLLRSDLRELGEAESIVRDAAVIGREFSGELLNTISMKSRNEISRGLALAESVQIIRRILGSVDQYEFRHALIRDAAYKSLLRRDQETLHRRVAETLNKDDRVRQREPELIARHFQAGKDHVNALAMWERAGEFARQRSANREAANHFRNALDVLRCLPERDVKTELLLQTALGAQLIACHGNGAAIVEAHYERAKELCDELGDPNLLSLVLPNLVGCYMVRGRVGRAREVGEELLFRLKRSEQGIQAHRPFGLCLFAQGEFKKARWHLNRSIELYDPQQDCVHQSGYTSDPLVLARCNLGWVHCFLNDTGQATVETEAALAYAQKLEHRHSLAFALSFAVSCGQTRNDLDYTVTHCEKLIEFAQCHGFPYWLAWGRILLGWAMTHSGEVAGGAKAIDEGMISYQRTESEMFMPYFLTLRAETEISLERFGDALGRVEAALNVAARTGTRFYIAETYRIRGLALRKKGDRVSSQTAFQKGLSVAAEQGCTLLTTRIEKTMRE